MNRLLHSKFPFGKISLTVGAGTICRSSWRSTIQLYQGFSAFHRRATVS